MKKARSQPCPKSLILLVEQRGVEPLTSALRTRRSAKLSYCPTRVAILGSAVVECQACADRRDQQPQHAHIPTNEPGDQPQHAHIPTDGPREPTTTARAHPN